MSKKEVLISYLALIALHILLTVGMALVFGLNHPMARYYEIGSVTSVTVASVVFSIPLYAIGGYLFIIAKENKRQITKSLFLASFIFTLVLLMIWFSVRIANLNGVTRNVWLIYVISNYPTALFLNVINTLSDIRSPLILVTTFAPALGFLLGSLLRLVSEPKYGSGGKNG